jgi:hypothetical protein
MSTDAVGVGRGVLGGHFAVGLQVLLVAGDPNCHAPEVTVLHGRLIELCCVIIIIIIIIIMRVTLAMITLERDCVEDISGASPLIQPLTAWNDDTLVISYTSTAATAPL